MIAIALLSVVGSTASAAGSRPGSRTVDNPTCTLPGIRYVGTVLHGGRLCFTLARNGRAVLEWGATFCPESHLTGGVGSSFAKPPKLRSPDHLVLRTSDTVTEGSIGPPEPISLLLEGRLSKGRGKGTLSWHLVFDTKTGGRCSWSARRVG